MTTTTKDNDYMGRDLITPDTDARDYLGRAIMAGDRDYMGRALTDDPGGGGDASALLTEAAVRFDFSQYDDINDMVDVNGGWGPVAPNIFGATPEFTVDGLHLVGDGVQRSWALNEVAGPLVIGSDGMTFMDVVRIDAPFNPPPSAGENSVSFVDLACDAADDFAPQVTLYWNVRAEGGDAYRVYANDVAPGYDGIVFGEQDTYPSGLDSQAVEGVYIFVTVFDVAESEVRYSLVSPSGRFDQTVPFDKTPDFAADPRTVDYISFAEGQTADDTTSIEWGAWNRALTPSEVDALVAHFTP